MNSYGIFFLKSLDDEENYVEYDDIDILLGEIYLDPESIETEEEQEDKQPSNMNSCCNNSLLIAAWTVSNLGIFVSAFFVILYSMEWGAEKSNSWLISYLLSFVENAFLADPIKVFKNNVKLSLWFPFKNAS